MGFFEMLSSSLGGHLGDVIGNVGDVLGISSAFVEDKDEADGLAIGSGAAGILSSLMGIGGGIGTLNDASKSEKDKSKARWDIVGNSLGTVAGIADTAGGFAGLKGNQKAKSIAGYISGGANILGGAIGGGEGIYDLIKNWKIMNVGEKTKAFGGLAGNAGKIFSGITGIGAAKNPHSKDWELSGQISSVVGMGAGLLNTGLGFWDTDKP